MIHNETVDVHPDLRKVTSERTDNIIMAWVVMHMTSKGKRQKRVLLMTHTYLMLALKGGDVSRVVKVRDIGELRMRLLDPVDTSDKTTCSGEVCLLMKDENEPVMLLRIRDDRRNRPMSSSLTDFEKIFTRAVRNAGGSLTVTQNPATLPLCTTSEQQKATDYLSPSLKSKIWERSPSPPRNIAVHPPQPDAPPPVVTVTPDSSTETVVTEVVPTQPVKKKKNATIVITVTLDNERPLLSKRGVAQGDGETSIL